jgi:UDP-N-acetylglucosamine 4,6-dehydratase
MITDKVIIIFGGSGSLGNALIKRYINNNIIYVYSRDENKHWSMNLIYNNNPNLKFIIGDIRDLSKVKQSLLRVNAHIVIIASALKHIDKCEYESNESINTNLIGTQNIINSIEILNKDLLNLETTCFISTDKACSPVNIYGMCKALSESIIIEKANYINNKKFVAVRYGNVLNSRGSILPILHEIGQNDNYSFFKLTDDKMTRFIMTLDESVDLIEYAINSAESGDIVIPRLKAMKIIDLIELFSQKYNKPIQNIGLRPGEKINESLINNTQSTRTIEHNDYFIIKPYFNCIITNKIYDYHSGLDTISKDKLYNYLQNINMI